MHHRVDWPNVAFGLFLLALAATVFWTTAPLRVGAIDEMGPGFVPRSLAWAVLAFGASFVTIGLFSDRRAFPSFAWRPLIAINGAIVAFALLTTKFGLALSVVVTILVAGAAQAPYHWRQQTVFAAIIAAFSVLLFIKFIGIPLPIWWR